MTFSTELRRVDTSTPCTSVLPNTIPLPQEGHLDAISIGRHRTNDVQLDCPSVPSLLSRRHAKIQINARGMHSVEDMNTLNGTYLNGNIIPTGPCLLAHGDVITFGGTTNVLRDGKELRNSFKYTYHNDKQREMQIKQRRKDSERLSREAEGATVQPVAKRTRCSQSAGNGIPRWADDALRCAICTEIFVKPLSINGCGHTFCSGCILRWISVNRHPSCPTCRHIMIGNPYMNLTRNIMSQCLFDNFVLPCLSLEDVQGRAKRSCDDLLVIAGIAGVRPVWEAVGISADAVTPCFHCGAPIPARFMRLKRTVVLHATKSSTYFDAATASTYFHAHFGCLRSKLAEIRGVSAVTILPELSEQERRVVHALIALTASSAETPARAS